MPRTGERGATTTGCRIDMGTVTPIDPTYVGEAVVAWETGMGERASVSVGWDPGELR